MNFTLAGFDQVSNVRSYHFDGVHDDRSKHHFVVRVDLELVRRYKIPVQELPLLCIGMLERDTRTPSMMFTETDMVTYTENRAAAAAAGSLKRRKSPHPIAKRATSPGWSRPDWANPVGPAR